MVHHHPNENLLIEYSAGSLDLGLSIMLSAHIEMCEQCANKLAELNAIGGEFLLSHPDAADITVSEDMLQNLLEKINSGEPWKHLDTIPSATQNDGLPKMIGKVIDRSSLQWRKLSRDLEAAHLTLGQKKYEANLHRIRKGGRVAQHDHRGEEFTLVLSGSFSDEDGSYKAGDFVERGAGQTHMPIAAANEDCLCFSLVEAPVKLTGWVSRMLNPFLRHRPA